MIREHCFYYFSLGQWSSVCNPSYSKFRERSKRTYVLFRRNAAPALKQSALHGGTSCPADLLVSSLLCFCVLAVLAWDKYMKAFHDRLSAHNSVSCSFRTGDIAAVLSGVSLNDCEVVTVNCILSAAESAPFCLLSAFPSEFLCTRASICHTSRCDTCFVFIYIHLA